MNEIVSVSVSVSVSASPLSGKFVCVESGLLDRSQAYEDLFNSNELGHDQG